MNYVDKDRILSESPKKRLIIGFEKLKTDFTESAAMEYSNLYKNEPLSFIVENSRLIFSEPYYGTQFYKNVICGENEYCLFTEYNSEYEKVLNYIEEHAPNMSEAQVAVYQELADAIFEKTQRLSNTIMMANYAMEHINDYEKEFPTKLSDLLYCYANAKRDQVDISGLEEKILELMDTVNDRTTFFVYGPFVNRMITGTHVIESSLGKYYQESYTEEDALNPEIFKPFIENVFIISKLSCDQPYVECVDSITNVTTRMIFEGYATECAKSQFDELITERVSSVDTFYSSPKNAVNRIFEDEYESELFKEDYNDYRNTHFGLQNIVLESLMDMITYEYQMADDTGRNITGYNFFVEGTTVEGAFKELAIRLSEVRDILGIVTEDVDEEDEEIKKLESDFNSDDSKDEKKASSSKKVEAPKAKNTANKVQFKAMDAEVKQNKKMASAKQKGQEIKNAVKAVAALPLNVVEDIKSQIKNIDKADADKRKRYMTEPGFRKKAFKNLKLAMMYGTAAQIKLAAVPALAVSRHFSKERDRRIRNELLVNINTNIKVCEEKISDANAAGDNQEKYKLIRIKEELEAERLRVRTNSKYI